MYANQTLRGLCGYVARLIEKVVETLLVDGATTPLQGVTSCQLLGNHCKIYSDIV